ncbi:MAG: hypothetical protein EA342_16945 [Leptolyngbya sp. LCM1.Bin17]|jgi:hypothetical protein|nr:MAG: hypothetical protein EA342_16945 [Leptolyngbya sp. LCM1.Bin17]
MNFQFKYLAILATVGAIGMGSVAALNSPAGDPCAGADPCAPAASPADPCAADPCAVADPCAADPCAADPCAG